MTLKSIIKMHILKTIIITLAAGLCVSACSMFQSTETRIVSAIQTGDITDAKQLIATSYDLNLITESDSFPLLEAAYTGNVELAKLMISKNADINLQNQRGMTALMAAVDNGHKPLIHYLIQQKADPALKTAINYSALHIAVDRGNREIMDLLLSSTSPDVYAGKDAISLFIPAINNDDVEMVDYLLRNHISPEPNAGEGMPPLATAAISPNPGIVSLMLENGASVHTKNDDGEDSLWTVGSLDKLFLIEKIYSLADPEFFEFDFADPKRPMPSKKIKIGFKNLVKNLKIIADSQDQHNKIKGLKEKYDFGFMFSNISEDKILSIVEKLEKNYVNIAGQLVEAGADINTTDRRNRSILIMLCQQKEINPAALFTDKTIRLAPDAQRRLELVIAGADKIHGALTHSFLEKTDINLPDEYGNTPLLLTCGAGAQNIAFVLIENGAEINVSNKDGWTPLITAASAMKYDVAELLLKRGAQVNVANKFGETALLKAVYNQDAKMAKLLLEHGANCQQANIRGDSPANVAKKKGYTGITALFAD